MQNIENLVRGRRSVRTFDERNLTADDLEKLRAFLAAADNPYHIPVQFTLLDAKEQRLSCPVVVGTDLYVGGKVSKVPHAEEAFGYSFEQLVLYAQSLGVGTVWIGGTMDRGAFERALQLAPGEMMPCASPLGYPAQKMSVRESVMRKTIKADSRMSFDEVFFDGSFATPLTKEKAGKLAFPLEMVRLAPSAVNRQPWRVVVTDNAVHFYKKQAKAIAGSFDMQKIDLGIALCHFALAAEESGVSTEFSLDATTAPSADGMEYIASYRLD